MTVDTPMPRETVADSDVGSKNGTIGHPRSQGMLAVCWFTGLWALALVALCLHRNGAFVYDDTFITLRYARHLIAGHGLVWNISGERVEGFSSPLHVLLVAAVGSLGVPLVEAARAIGFASHAVLLLFLWSFVRGRVGPFPAALVCALVGASWPFLVWDSGGLDAILFAAAATAGVLVSLQYVESGSRRTLLVGAALLGVATLTRPEGAVTAAATLGMCLVAGTKSIRDRVGDVTLAALVSFTVFLPWELFRLAYYHAALANTYYAKVVGIPFGWRVRIGTRYWADYLRTAPFLPVWFGVVAVANIAKRRVRRFDVALWVVIAVMAWYVVAVGGDHMMGYRFMIPLIPLLAVTIVLGFVRLGWTRTVPLAAMASLGFAVLSIGQMRPLADNPERQDVSSRMGEVIAAYITKAWAPGSLIGINVAGTTAYYADQMRFIDMLGLNDREIARRNPVPIDLPTVHWIGHLKGDGASVLARHPDYIIPRGGGGPVLRPEDTNNFLGDYELAHSPAFWHDYQACEVDLKVPPALGPEYSTLSFVFMKRRDLTTPCVAPAGYEAGGQRGR